MHKDEARLFGLAAREAMSPEERNIESRKIAEKLFAMPEYKYAKRVFIYLSTESECDTRQIARHAINTGKQVFACRFTASAPMEFFEYHKALISNELLPGELNAMRPERDLPVVPRNGDLFLVPGTAFDKNGHRTGLGAGCYDKYFSKYSQKRLLKAGLCFRSQLVEHINADDTDIPMDFIIHS